MNFREWYLITESEEVKETVNTVYSLFKNQLPNINQSVLTNIYQAAKVVKERNIQVKIRPYIEYMFGFFLTKPNAREEDYLMSADEFKLYHNKVPSLMKLIKERYPHLIGLNPFQLGKHNNDLRNAINQYQPSNTQKKLIGKDDLTYNEDRVIKKDINGYTFVTIPRAKNDKEVLENKALYCKYGKGTDWCTAHPQGTYYTYYVRDLDITIVMKNGMPLYQFGLKDGNIDNRLSQFMDVKDKEVIFLPKSLYSAMLNIPEYEQALSINDIDSNVESILRIDKPSRAPSWTNRNIEKWVKDSDLYTLRAYAEVNEITDWEDLMWLAIRKNNPLAAYAYAYVKNNKSVKPERIPKKLEDIILKSDGYTVAYAHLLGRLPPEMEEELDLPAARSYAKDVLNGRLPESLEDRLIRTPYQVYEYSEIVGELPEKLELRLKGEPLYAIRYAKLIMKRLPKEVEDEVMVDRKHRYYYVKAMADLGIKVE